MSKVLLEANQSINIWDKFHFHLLLRFSCRFSQDKIRHLESSNSTDINQMFERDAAQLRDNLMDAATDLKVNGASLNGYGIVIHYIVDQNLYYCIVFVLYSYLYSAQHLHVLQDSKTRSVTH